MQLEAVLAQPAPPDNVVGPPGCDERPEAGPVAEHAQVGQLVYDDGLERGGRREDERPAEGQARPARRASPAAAGVPDRHRARLHAEGRRMAADLPIDGDAGSRSERLHEDEAERTPVGAPEPNDKLVGTEAGRAWLPADRRPPRRGRADRDHPQSMQLAAIRHERAVGERTERLDPGALSGLAIQVATQPRLALGQELLDLAFRGGPSTAPGERNAHDDAELAVERHAQRPAPGGSAQSVPDRSGDEPRRPL